MATNAEIIDLLKEDMRDEHGALILYLQHAYFLGESGDACEIEATARDEMRHFKWLAQAIVQLGGVPALDRTEMEVGGPRPPQWMQRDVEAEHGAIAKYERHKAALDDERVRALIDNILTDERAHLEVFTGKRDKFSVSQEGVGAAALPSGGVPSDIAAIFDYGTRHEYTVTLQYLLHSFLTSSHEASRELEMVAVNEMQHMGWFGELAAEMGHAPLFAHDPLEGGAQTPLMIQADLAAEEAVARAYAEQLQELSGRAEHQELSDVIERARQNELYHIHRFNLMMDGLAAQEEPYQRPGIGPTQPAEEPTSEPPPALEAAVDTGGREGGFTVGSLVE